MSRTVDEAIAVVEDVLARHHLALGRERQRILGDYLEHLLEWNRRVNLISRRAEGESLGQMVADCLFPVIVKPEVVRGRVIDLGSGAGLPGLVLKIWDEELAMTLVESVRKKALFLEWITGRMGLGEVSVMRRRAEELADELEGRFDLVCTRGTGPLGKTFPIAMRYAKRGGSFIAFKPSDCRRELGELERSLGGKGGVEYELFDAAGLSGKLMVFRRR